MALVSLRFLVFAFSLFAASAAIAVDIFSTPDKADALATARARIAEKNWPEAIEELRKVNDSASADWNNLLGYSLRKSDPPNLAAAEKHYDQALRIAPRHRGALEYSGELYLMTGKLEKAEQRLAALDKACFLPCDEYSDLKRAVARYKAAGNKHVAQ
ncbi:MAG: tetratricopeptide repeat protein [Caldimonas sp.]